MLVDASHRATTQIYLPEVYHRLAQDCVDALQATRCVSSIVICGSVVKSDIVPGWSDLDLIVFLPASSRRLTALAEIRDALRGAKGDVQIGVGVDVVFEDEFEVTNKLCGRPLAMSYEVAAYGETRFGRNQFISLRPLKVARQQLDHERSIGISAEIHNWRRSFLAQGQLECHSLTWASACVKTVLKVLKFEAGPSSEAPFTYRGSLDRIHRSHPSHLALSVFSEAVKLRESWLQSINNPELFNERIALIISSLVGYPACLGRG